MTLMPPRTVLLHWPNLFFFTHTKANSFCLNDHRTGQKIWTREDVHGLFDKLSSAKWDKKVALRSFFGQSAGFLVHEDRAIFTKVSFYNQWPWCREKHFSRPMTKTPSAQLITPVWQFHRHLAAFQTRASISCAAFMLLSKCWWQIRRIILPAMHS